MAGSTRRRTGRGPGTTRPGTRHGTRRAARRGPWGAVAGLAGAAAVVLGTATAGLLGATERPAPPVAVAASVVPAPAAAPWTRSVPQPAPAPVVDAGGAVATGSGMPVPQPPRPVRTGLLITPFAAHGRSPEMVPRPSPCGGSSSTHQVPPGATPGPGGTATVSWPAGGRAEVTGYRVSAVSQVLVPGEQPVPLQRTAAQPAGCATVAVGFTGLVPGEVYVFWLEERTVDPATQRVQFVQLGTSGAVRLP